MSGKNDRKKELRVARLRKIAFIATKVGDFLERHYWPIWIIAVVGTMTSIWQLAAPCIAAMFIAFIGPMFTDWLTERIDAHIKQLGNGSEVTP